MKVTNTLVFLLTFATVQAQQTWSLEDCINHALVNNIALKQSELTIELNENTHTQSNLQLLPSVNANTSAFRNTGRYINPFTNQFIEEVSTSLNLSFSSNLTLFNGFKNINQIKKAANEVLKSTYDLESAKNELISSIALSYLQILFNEEAFLTSKEQFNLTNAQEARIKTLVDAGSLAKGELLNIQSQKALEEQQLVQTENQLNLSKLQLAQLLDLENYQELEIKLNEKRSKESKAKVGHKKDILTEAKERRTLRAQDLESKKAELDEIIAETQTQEEKLMKKSKSALKNLDARLSGAYSRLRLNAKNGLAVVPVDRDSCGGCFNKIPPQRQLDIHTKKKVIACEHCGRILVPGEEAEVAK